VLAAIESFFSSLSLNQGLKNETKRNKTVLTVFFLETKENEKYWRKRETKRNEKIFKETNLKRKKKSVSRTKK
jgi:hypothetical protein